MNWLKKLFNPCAHKWEPFQTFALNRAFDGNRVGTMYVLRCAHCGDLRQKRV